MSNNMNTSELKLEETTNYLVTIAKRVMSDFPYGMGAECYFISEDVKNALENIGGELADTFAKEIENAGLQKKLSKRKDIKEAIKEIEKFRREMGRRVEDEEIGDMPFHEVNVRLTKIKQTLTGGE